MERAILFRQRLRKFRLTGIGRAKSECDIRFPTAIEKYETVGYACVKCCMIAKIYAKKNSK